MPGGPGFFSRGPRRRWGSFPRVSGPPGGYFELDPPTQNQHFELDPPTGVIFNYAPAHPKPVFLQNPSIFAKLLSEAHRSGILQKCWFLMSGYVIKKWEFRKFHTSSSKDPPGGPETRGNDPQGPRDRREKVGTPSGILWIFCLGGFKPKYEFRPGRGFTTYDPTVV